MGSDALHDPFVIMILNFIKAQVADHQGGDPAMVSLIEYAVDPFLDLFLSVLNIMNLARYS